MNINKIIQKYKIKPIYKTFKRFFVFLYDLRLYINYKLSITLFILIAAVFIVTNFVITGYPLFPQDFVGPLHSHSINTEILQNLKRGAINWHRFQNSFGNNNYWVINYLNTRNGLITILFWFIPSLFSIIITFFLNKLDKFKKVPS